MSTAPTVRTRRDRCPGVLRPWPAGDGLLVRLRLVGGRLPLAALGALLDVAERYGDGRVRVTARANLQLRGLPGHDGVLPDAVVADLEETGLIPSRSHERVRNIMASPATGIAGGRCDLRPVSESLDRALCGEPRLSRLPGRFLFVLDDGRGDLVERTCDLGLVGLDASTVQLRVGATWGEVIPVGDAARAMVALAVRFSNVHVDGPSAPWHVAELPTPLVPARDRDDRVPAPGGPLALGPVPGGRHVVVPPSGLDRASAAALLTGAAGEVVVTPWHGIFVPEGGIR